MRILDNKRQALFAIAHKACSPLNLKLQSHIDQLASYLHFIESPYEWQAFTLARCNVFPSNILYSSFNSQPLETGLCSCKSGALKSQEHMLLHCVMYNDIGSSNLKLILFSSPGWEEVAILYNLLLGVNKTHTRQMAKYIILLIQQKGIQLLNKHLVSQDTVNNSFSVYVKHFGRMFRWSIEIELCPVVSCRHLAHWFYSKLVTTRGSKRLLWSGCMGVGWRAEFRCQNLLASRPTAGTWGFIVKKGTFLRHNLREVLKVRPYISRMRRCTIIWCRLNGEDKYPGGDSLMQQPRAKKYGIILTEGCRLLVNVAVKSEFRGREQLIL